MEGLDGIMYMGRRLDIGKGSRNGFGLFGICHFYGAGRGLTALQQFSRC